MRKKSSKGGNGREIWRLLCEFFEVGNNFFWGLDRG